MPRFHHPHCKTKEVFLLSRLKLPSFSLKPSPLVLWHTFSNCKGVKHSEQASMMKIQQPRGAISPKPPVELPNVISPQRLTSATAYLPFPQYLGKQPGDKGTRLLCGRAGQHRLLPSKGLLNPALCQPCLGARPKKSHSPFDRR